jgi:outer membrane protein OmpA-like peptidoglycan-associated protein
MMTLRAGRRAFYLGFVALCGIGGSALPASAQSYLADNGSSNVTVDYSVLGLGSGPGPVARGTLPGAALPAGSCSCANAPLGVIAAAPRPTFTNPFGAQITQAPAVPPGFVAYSAMSGSSGSSSDGAVVLREPSAPTQMAASAPAPVEEMPAADLPTNTPTQSESTGGESTGGESSGAAATAEPTLPVTTPTQTQPSASSEQAAAPSGEATPPAQPEEMPTNVPSPVETPAEPAPAAQAPAAETPAEPTPAPAETQTAETPPASEATPQPEAQPQGEQQAAVAPETTPAAPAEGTTPPAEGGAALPAGATRILYTGESDDVPPEATAGLDTIAQDMMANQDKRIQVLSYAAGTEDTESKARRKSLARGLAIRSYLMKAGVPSTRIDVRALGNKAEGGPADRVDIIPAS